MGFETGDHELKTETNGDDEQDEKPYPLLMVIGMAFGLAIGSAIGGGVVGMIGFVVGGGLGKAIDAAIRKRIS